MESQNLFKTTKSNKIILFFIINQQYYSPDYLLNLLIE